MSCTTVDLLKGAQKCHDNQLVLTQRGLLEVRNIKKSKSISKKAKQSQKKQEAKKAKSITTTKSK